MIERWRTQAAGLGVEADAMDAVVGRTHPRLVVRGEIDRTIERARRSGRADRAFELVRSTRRAARLVRTLRRRRTREADRAVRG